MVGKRRCFHRLSLSIPALWPGHWWQVGFLAKPARGREWGSFINKLTYKARSAGGWVEKVNAAYQSVSAHS